MPEKFLVEFLADWIRDPDFRKRVLYRERTELGPDGYKLDGYQITDLLHLKADDIVTRLRGELENDLKIDLAAILKDINDTGGFGPATPPGGAGSAYEEGNPHVRGVTPKKIALNVESVVVVRGHGWNDSLEILFETPGTKVLVPSTRLHLDSDIDVWQRATVSSEFKVAGKWRVIARIKVKQQDGSEKQVDSNENVNVDAT